MKIERKEGCMTNKAAEIPPIKAKNLFTNDGRIFTNETPNVHTKIGTKSHVSAQILPTMIAIALKRQTPHVCKEFS